MRFRKVASDVWQPSKAGAGRTRRETRPGDGPRRNRDLVMTFIGAWNLGDRATLAALTTPDVSCRWTGFGAAPVHAQGLDAIIRLGRDFERRYGKADRYTLEESMGGQRHAAILLEPDATHPEGGHAARIAVYRLEGDCIAAIAVYGDQLD